MPPHIPHSAALHLELNTRAFDASALNNRIVCRGPQALLDAVSIGGTGAITPARQEALSRTERYYGLKGLGNRSDTLSYAWHNVCFTEAVEQFDLFMESGAAWLPHKNSEWKCQVVCHMSAFGDVNAMKCQTICCCIPAVCGVASASLSESAEYVRQASA